ncbi:LysR substrate-binding domain-containing protein [Phenylobacterium soli]|uniref:LysR family transcriptional regulator n=1 Tax=Phenylobacterium soli TaxID=2170551 RepID=A0A328AFE6_9CAUL|nr:LysR substrate-binding domain-containing protein [Phenylobacterium soli]RAK53462.1 LysR family transcriptional regulator [Phenylobacterium soli]
MTLEQLRIFAAVAERQHMTRAAEALNLTQSAVSAAIAALEGRYGARLFERVGRGVELSAEGAAFLPEARAVLERAEAAARALDDLAGLRRGRLTLAASQTVASYWLPPRLARFARAHPAIGLKLMAGNTAQAAEWVKSGSADLAFVEGQIETAELARAPVGGDTLGLYAAPDHPLVGRPIGPSQLKAASWVLRETGSGTRSHFEQALAARDVPIQALYVRLETPSNEAALGAVEAGGLVTAVSDLAAAALVGVGRVSRLACELPPRDFALLAHRERRRSRAAAAFLKML